MNLIALILILIAAVLLVLSIASLVYIKKKGGSKPDYYTLFVLGLVWFIIGIPLKNYVLSIMGFIFLIVGLRGRAKWKTNRVHWNDMGKKEKKFMIGVMILLTLFIIFGLVVLLVFRGGI